MSGYILNLPEDEGVVVSGQAARRLVEGGDGDAALLYIAVLRNRGNMDEGKLAGQLGWPEGRLRQALGSLVRQGLAAPPAREAAADAPPRREEDRTWHTVFGSRGDPESIRVQGPGPVPSAIHMDGKAVFRFAVEVVEKSIRQLLTAEGLASVNDLDLVVCHQANARIIDFVAKRLGAREGLFFKNMDRYGNTSAASIPIALDELTEAGALRPGMRIVTVGFGGGLTWAGALLRW